MDLIMQVAIDVARQGLAEGCIPIGSSSSSAMVSSSGGGHNRRVQEDNPVLHAEIGCLRNAGRIGSYRNTALCSTLMPCYLCAGAVVPFGIPGVVCGESRTFPGAQKFLEKNGVVMVDLDLSECTLMMQEFIGNNPALWNEDIGES